MKRRGLLLLAFVLASALTVCAQTVTSLYTLPGLYGTGALVEASDGGLYGLSVGGLTCGFLFRISLAGAYDPHGFDCPGSLGALGDAAAESITEAADGSFYGVTLGGGNHLDGTIFQFTPPGALTTFYSFADGSDGANSDSGEGATGLTQGSDGALYGATKDGGDAAGDGTIFRISPAGAYTQLQIIPGGTGHLGTAGSLLQASDGNFYGTTILGGSCNTLVTFYQCGTVFRVTPAGQFTRLYTFTGGTDGAYVSSGLVQGPDGALYGTARQGGNLNLNNGGGFGTIFKITLAGELTTLYTFQDGPDGQSPSGGLFLASDGAFYGTSEAGSIFRLTPAGQFTTLVAVGPGPGSGGLLQASDGNFYGTKLGSTIAHTDAQLYRLAYSAASAPPVQLALNQSSVPLGTPVTLSWKVLNAFSTTMQQCYAYVQNGATGAGNWTGLQPGTLQAGVYSGAATLTPTQNGVYTYALTCGGIESGFATLTAGTSPPLTITANLPPGTVGLGYTAALAAQGGVAPYDWSLASGSLPPGLSLGSSGQISGTPTMAGTANFVATVRDTGNPAAMQSANLRITIAAGVASVVSHVVPSSIAAGQTASFSAAITAGAATPTGTVQFFVNGVGAGAPVQIMNGQATLPNQLFVTPGTYSIVASYSGDVNYRPAASQAATLLVGIGPPSINANPSTFTVSAQGDSADTVLSVSGFHSSSLIFACGPLPYDASCSFGQLTGTGSSGTATLHITTKAPVSAALRPPGHSSGRAVGYALILPGLFSLSFAFFGRCRAMRRRGFVALTLMFSLLTVLSGCGVTLNGTPTGTRAITITANSAGQSATTVVQLVVR